MHFAIEKVYLTDGHGVVLWDGGPPPHRCGDADGGDVRTVLTGLVAQDGGVALGVTAFADGQAVAIAEKGGRLYAVRAIPRLSAVRT